MSAEGSRSDAWVLPLSYPIPPDFPDSDRIACEYGIWAPASDTVAWCSDRLLRAPGFQFNRHHSSRGVHSSRQRSSC